MLPELLIIKYLLKYNLYKQYKPYVKIPPEYREVLKIWYSLERLQEKYPDRDKSLGDLGLMVQTCYPNLHDVEKQAIQKLLDKLDQTGDSDEILQNLLQTLVQRTRAREIALAAFEVSEGRADAGKLAVLATSFQDEHISTISAESKTWDFVTEDLFELEQNTVRTPGLKWRLECLNRSLGPLRAGDFGFVFARPETGKTTFLASEVTWMASQAEKPVIWFNNEEQGEKVRIRTYQAALGLTTDQLWAFKEKHTTLYK